MFLNALQQEDDSSSDYLFGVRINIFYLKLKMVFIKTSDIQTLQTKQKQK